MTAARTLTVLVPAFNEEAALPRTIDAACAAADDLRSRGVVDEVEIVVVDDGSTDRTPAVLAELSASSPVRIRAVRHPVNRGLGAAIRTGLQAVCTELVFYTDADLPVDLSAIGEALALMDERGAGAVCAYRLDRGGEGALRYTYSVVYNLLVRVVLGLRVRDVNFAAKLLRSEVVQGLDLRSEGSFIDAELVARLQRRQVRIEQFPAAYRPRSRGVSTLSSPSVIRTILRELLALTPAIRAEAPLVPSGA